MIFFALKSISYEILLYNESVDPLNMNPTRLGMLRFNGFFAICCCAAVIADAHSPITGCRHNNRPKTNGLFEIEKSDKYTVENILQSIIHSN